MRLSSIDTHLVVALHALLLEKSVTRAAKRIGVTQPTMSHALSRLRACFDDPLFVVEGRKLVPTPRAIALSPAVTAAIAGLERVFSDERPFDPARDARTFHVAATDNLELVVLPRLAHALAREAPHIDLRCRNLAADWADELRRGDLDIKLGRSGPPSPGIVRELLVRESFVCLLRRGHPALRRRLTRKRFLAAEHLAISPHSGEIGALDRTLAAAGEKRRIVITLSHFLVAPFVVAQSDLILTAPSRVVAALAPTMGVVAVECPIEMGGYGLELATGERAMRDGGVVWLRGLIKRVAAA